MGRKRAGKELKSRPIRVDEDVWAAMQRLKDEFETINEGLRVALLGGVNLTSLVPDDSFRGAKYSEEHQRAAARREPVIDDLDESPDTLADVAPEGLVVSQTPQGLDVRTGKRGDSGRPLRMPVPAWKRGPRQKGDKSR